MTQQETTPRRTFARPDVARLLFLAAAVLTVVAALLAGGVWAGSWVPWALGALAAVFLAWAVG